MTYLPSFAFATSPAHIDRGAAYEFVLNHAVDVGSPDELFRRPVPQGSLRDPDMHAGQQHVPLASLPVPDGHGA